MQVRARLKKKRAKLNGLTLHLKSAPASKSKHQLDIPAQLPPDNELEQEAMRTEKLVVHASTS